MGDIRLLSPLNSPLNARVDLVDVAPDEVNTIQAQIASKETFARYGLEWPGFLTSVQVRTVRTPDGGAYVTLKSVEPITDPFVTLLVEVSWSRGHLVREYTMLLDPPVYAPGPSQVASAPTVVPSTGAGAREGTIARAAETPTAAPAPAPSAAPAPPVVPPAEATTATAAPPPAKSTPAPSAEENAGASHLVRRGETLSGIASGVAGSAPNGTHTRNWILAIYQANPHAFDKNMNWMRAGAVLRIPDADAAAAVSPTEANAEIRRQYAAWRSGEGTPAPSSAAAQPGRLKLVTPTEAAPGASAAAASAASAAATAEINQLKGQVHDLEGQLADSRHQLDESKRLVEMKNSDLARLQSQLAAKQNAAAATPPPLPPPPVTTPPVEKTATAAPPPAAEQPPTSTQALPPPAAEEKPAPSVEAPPPPVAIRPLTPAAAVKKPAQPAPAAGGSLFDTLKDYWWALAVLLLVLIGFVIVRFLRARRASEFDQSLDRLTAAEEEVVFAEPEPPPLAEPPPPRLPLQPVRASALAPEPPPMRATAPTPDTNFLVEESGLHERPRFSSEPSAPAPAAKHVSADDTISSETAIHLDQGDPLAEADFHMAYGLYDQAADLIRLAIAREPERRDLRLKLLEVFFVWGNKEQFLQTARELADTRAAAAPGEWEKILIMGKQLAPEEALFSGAAPVSGAMAGGVDLDLEGGQSRVDFDLLGEAVPAGAAPEVDLDVGAAPIERGSSLDDTGGATDRNAALLEKTFSSATGTTRQMTAKLRKDATGAGTTAEMEGPTVEQPGLVNKDSTTRRRKVESALRASGVEQTAELAIDDLGLDLGQVDTVDQPGIASAAASSPDAATLVAGVDEHSRRVMEHAQQRTPHKDEEAASTGFWQFDQGDSDTGLTEAAPEAAATARISTLTAKQPSLDVELGEGTHTIPGGAAPDLDLAASQANGGALDLDVGPEPGAGSAGSPSFISTQRLDAEDLALPDLEPATMSEVGTKLDLARAYMDMGDPDGARNILEEVLNEGSAAQKQEAQRLMESLPG